jgi:hypothetical protein
MTDVVFTPSLNGPRRVVFLTAHAAGCTGEPALTKKAQCEATVGAGRVACVDGAAAALVRVPRNVDVRHLSFRFPDTDTFFEGADDDRTLTGPATIAVPPVAGPLPCGLATATCASKID